MYILVLEKSNRSVSKDVFDNFVDKNMKDWYVRWVGEIDNLPDKFILLCCCSGRSADDEKDAVRPLKEKGW